MVALTVIDPVPVLARAPPYQPDATVSLSSIKS